MAQWETLNRQAVFGTNRVILFRELITNGETERYSTFLAQKSPGVCIIPYFPAKNTFLVVRQFRNAIKQSIWQFPAGGIELGETPLQAAQRELMEETSFFCADLVDLGTFYPDSELIESSGNFFLAINPASKKAATVTTREKVDVKMISESDLTQHIIQDNIRDGWTLSAFC